MGSREIQSARNERNASHISSKTPTVEPSPMVEMSCWASSLACWL